jgi:hypothetical protein
LLEASHNYAPTPAVIPESVDRFLSSIAATEGVWNSR